MGGFPPFDDGSVAVIGINCLLNDAVSALAIAHAAGVGFIRVNVLCGARITDQGVIQGGSPRGAAAVVVSGGATGLPTDRVQVREKKGAAGDAPVLVGSGVTVENVRLFLGLADGRIVGTAVEEGGVAADPVDPRRVRELMARLGG